MDASTNSCGTTCSPSMAEPLTRHLDSAALLSELERLRETLATAGARHLDATQSVDAKAGPPPQIGEGEGKNEKALIFSCLAPGWTLESLRAALGEKGVGSDWFVTELSRSRFPKLAKARQPRLGGLLCPELAVYTDAAFSAALDQELESARRRGGDLTLILFELVSTRTPETDEMPGTEAAGRPDAENAKEGATPPVLLPDPAEAALCLALLCQTLKSSARGCDIPGLAGSGIGLIMPGAGGLRARAFAERLTVDFLDAQQRRGEGRTVEVTLRAGLACLESEDHPDAATLRERAQSALAEARPGGSRTWRSSAARIAERKTEVRAAEKKFLFFGSPESEGTPEHGEAVDPSPDAATRPVRRRPRPARAATPFGDFSAFVGSEGLAPLGDDPATEDRFAAFAAGFDAQGNAPEHDPDPEPSPDPAPRGNEAGR